MVDSVLKMHQTLPLTVLNDTQPFAVSYINPNNNTIIDLWLILQLSLRMIAIDVFMISK